MRSTGTFGCNGCDYRWGGALTAHCAACHNTFSGILAFDKHRNKGKCLDPATILNKHNEPALQSSGRAYPCWGLAGEKPDFWGGTP